MKQQKSFFASSLWKTMTSPNIMIVNLWTRTFTSCQLLSTCATRLTSSCSQLAIFRMKALESFRQDSTSTLSGHPWKTRTTFFLSTRPKGIYFSANPIRPQWSLCRFALRLLLMNLNKSQTKPLSIFLSPMMLSTWIWDRKQKKNKSRCSLTSLKENWVTKKKLKIICHPLNYLTKAK